jgi:hypothetical protein
MVIGFVRALKGKYEYRFQPIVSDPAIEIATNTNLTLKTIEVVDLSGSGLQGSGEPGSIRTTCPRIKELDIARTRVREWGEIIRIVEQLRVGGR